jgi:hypothetical protein
MEAVERSGVGADLLAAESDGGWEKKGLRPTGKEDSSFIFVSRWGEPGGHISVPGGVAGPARGCVGYLQRVSATISRIQF